MEANENNEPKKESSPMNQNTEKEKNPETSEAKNMNIYVQYQKEINQGKDLSALPIENEKLAWVDSGISPEVADFATAGANKAEENIPTDEEIGKAVRTLQRAGINPVNYMGKNPYNNEYAQLNAILNDGNQNYPNDYSTMMMMNGSKNISPQLMQTFMQQQMMGGFGF